MTEIYRTAVTDIGPLAASFLDEGMLVTFGDGAPDELREFCFIVTAAHSAAAIQPGQTLWMDDTPFTVTAVGDVAQRNLDALGHVTIRLDAATVPSLAGAIHVDGEGRSPALAVGSTLVITSRPMTSRPRAGGRQRTPVIETPK